METLLALLTLIICKSYVIDSSGLLPVFLECTYVAIVAGLGDKQLIHVSMSLNELWFAMRTELSSCRVIMSFI